LRRARHPPRPETLSVPTRYKHYHWGQVYGI
jgi:hypothetical protein